MITFDEFKKTELRVATITAAERVEGSEKLIKLQLDLGVSASVAEEKAPVEGEEQISVSEPVRETRQIVAGIGKQIIIVANLAPRALMGIESHGMLLAASSEEGPILLMPEKAAPSGAQVG